MWCCTFKFGLSFVNSIQKITFVFEKPITLMIDNYIFIVVTFLSLPPRPPHKKPNMLRKEMTEKPIKKEKINIGSIHK